NFPPAPGSMNKATGLGDIELYCLNAPLELGNRIWLDGDGDGIQDADEVGIDGVAVNLYRDGILVGQTTTAGGGRYLFNSTNVNLNGASGILPGTTYQIAVATTSNPLKGLFITSRDSDGSTSGDLHDSDALAVGSNAVINVTTGATGQSDHNLDFGFGVMKVALSDPASCLSPGGLVEIVVELGNPTAFNAPDGAGAELTIDLPTSVSRIVSALSKTGSSGSGNVTVNGASQILWNGALNSGDKVTLTYLVQIAAVQTGTQICPRSTAAYDSNFDGTKESMAVIDFCMPVNCPAAGAGTPVPVDTDPSDLMAGSVLLYNIYTSSVNPNRQDTRLTITNTNPVRSTYVHLFFIDGQTCAAADRFITLTPSQTTSFLASDIDPLTTGYLLAVATDQNGCPTRFNYLIGSEYVKFESGHAANLTAIGVPAPGQIACDPSQPAATLIFNGLSYNRLPRTLAIDSLPSVAEANQTMLVVNRLGGDLSSAAVSGSRFFGLLFDDLEKSSSFNLSSASCQMRGIISTNFPRSVPRYDQVIPAGRTGWMKLWTEVEQGLSGASINFNGANNFSQGHNLHVLSQTSSVTYTVPVYPPQ
ncbi:MAG: SdrD B-like domain-containing protein, partial [Acidobacteriota bacterium]